MKAHATALSRVLPALLALCATGCAWGRSIAPPAAAAPATYVTELPPEPPVVLVSASSAPSAPPPSADNPAVAAPPPVAASTPPPPGPASPLWWTAFADTALDAAVDEALHNNYFLRDVHTLIHENELNPAIPNGPLWPLQIGTPAQLQHATTAYPASPGQPGYTLTENELDVRLVASYQLDVWGQLDAQRKTFGDLVEQQRQSTETFAQTLAEQVTQAWFEILEQRALRVH